MIFILSCAFIAVFVSLLGACAKIKYLQEEIRQYRARERAGRA